MKGKLVIGMVLLLVSSLVLGACGAGVSQEDYDAVVTDRDAARSDLSEAQTQIGSLQEDYDAVVADRDAARSDLSEAQTQIGSLQEDYDAVVADRDAARSDLSEAQTQIGSLQEDYNAVVAAIDASYTGKEVEVAVGGSFTVILESNPTTGFMWELARNTDEAVLELVDQEFIAPETALIGAGGKELWTFKALKKGTSEISMEYRRPWEQGVQPAETFVLTVLVK